MRIVDHYDGMCADVRILYGMLIYRFGIAGLGDVVLKFTGQRVSMSQSWTMNLELGATSSGITWYLCCLAQQLLLTILLTVLSS